MRFSIDYSTLQHPKELRKISPINLRRIHDAIDRKLRWQPNVFGKPLRLSLFGNRCIRVGDYRITYHIDGSTVHILRIAHRSVVYRDE